jgi:non-specific serine/threonine protein kinase
MNSPAAPGGPSAGQRRWQLPADVSGFVGRGAELARLAGLLQGARAVTVAGPGGVGKTRLALRAAADATPADGNCLVELSGLTEPDLLPDTVAVRLGLQRASAASGLDVVLDELRGKRLLLILDTCEHLTAACARFVRSVLQETSHVTVLATSRQPLHVPGEEVLRLGPLPVPSTNAGTGDAVELFTQRAAAAVSGFRLTEPDLPDVIRLCRRLDGIPLAIELAAVRVRALPVAELAARVDAGLAVGTGTRRGTISRHQTLHAAIDWSYGLCTAAEKAAWRRLSVFAGTFDPAVARDVIAALHPPDDLPPERTDEVLDGLVDKSVVLPADGGRFRLLDSLREYGAERLAEAGEEAECRERHLTKYLSLAREFSRRLNTDGQQDRLTRLRAEHANIRGALEYGLTDGFRASSSTGGPAAAARAAAAASAPVASKLATSLFSYWVMSGSNREGMRWQDKVLHRFREPSQERASALANLSLLGTAVGVGEAVEQANEAIAMAARIGDERTLARAYLALQFALATAGRYEEALEVATLARRRLESLGADHALRTLDMQLALTHVQARNPDAAQEAAQRLLRGLAPGERWLRGGGHALSALAFYQQGRQIEAENAATAAVRETDEIGYLVGEGYSLEVLAWLAVDAGRCQRAAWLLGAAHALWERTGGRLSGSSVLEGYHQRAAELAASTLGEVKYKELHAAGAARPVTQIAALAVAGADVLPEEAEPAGEPSGWEGSDGLTAREREIAVLVARGLSNRDIAARLVISKRTVDAHVNHIFAKLGLSSRVQLTIWLRDRLPVRLADELSPAAHA